MSRLWMAGAELTGGTTASEAAVDGIVASGAITRDTGTFRSGVAAYKFDSAAGATAQMNGFAVTVTSLTIYFRFYLNTSASVGGNVQILQFGPGISGLRLNTSGQLILTFNGVNQSGNSGVVNDGQWYRVEYSVTHDGSNQATAAELRVDGVSYSTFSGTVGSSASITPNFGWLNNPGASKVLYMDDIAINNSSGGSNNSWPGSGKVVLLKPSTDSAVGSGWTLGTGTAIAGNSGATAVKNTPPLGVADLAAGSDTKQIRNASSNTADYDTGLDSYTTAGLATGDTVNAVMPFIITGAPSATGAKSGNLVLVSNPAGATDSHGTYRASANAGTYPTGWKATRGTIQDAPSVTLATQPVLRADITSGTATRVAMVCSMGLYVDYTPSAGGVAPPIRSVGQAGLQAVNRAATY